MKKFTLVLMLVLIVAASSAQAQDSEKHALGNMYTHALNAISAKGQLDTLEPPRHVRITNIHADHGQVFVTAVEESGPETFVYDMMSSRMVPQDDNAQKPDDGTQNQ